MIRKAIDFALANRLMVLGGALVLFVWGIISFHALPIEAYPDVADTYAQVITQWPGHAAEEVEQQITVPLEVELNGVAHLTHLRSVSLMGLSVITIIYDDDIPTINARQEVLDRLQNVTLPAGVSTGIGPDYSPTGQIMFYTLTSTNPKYDVMELKALNDWFVVNQLKSVPNIVDVNPFGGPTREYQVQLDPAKLVSYGLSLPQVEQSLIANNINAGGGFIERGQQALNVRAVGLMQTTGDIAATVVKVQNGTPVRVRDLGNVVQAPKVRLGQLGRTIHKEDGTILNEDDVVEGIVLLRKGAVAETTLDALHQKIDQLNGVNGKNGLLPAGVKLIPHLDRSQLMHHTTHTVLRNLTDGVLLVTLILFLFLGNVRSALIVAVTIPFSLLFAAILLDLRHIPANLLSLGALDFGMVVDGSVVMVENILRHASFGDRKKSFMETIAIAAHEVQRPVFFARVIIIVSYLPIFTLQRVEGRLFSPMAWTVAFALLGALVFALFVAPVLCSFLFNQEIREWRNPVLEWLNRTYARTLDWCFDHMKFTLGMGVLGLGVMLFFALSGIIGSEFLPHLDEGAIWVRGTLAPSTGPSSSMDMAKRARILLADFPEVSQVVSQVGRPDDGSDASGFYNTEFFVDLRPRDEWRSQFHGSKDELIAAMDQKLQQFPGVDWNFSQPISDNVEEAVSGVKGELAVKLFGRDLKTLEQKAEEMQGVMSQVPGVADLGTFQVRGQPNVNLNVDRAAADRFGINVSDVQDAVETAVGGKPLSQILIGEQRFDLTVRYQPQFRRTVEDISAIRLVAPSGERVSLSQLCKISLDDGASTIYREGNSRYIAIKYSVRGRDLGSTVRQAIEEVGKKVKLPEGYHLDWTGEYESQQRANRRLAIIVPVTLLLMSFILYSAFNSWKWVFLILAVVALSPLGGFLSLLVTGTHFSVSSGLGFLALIGVSVEIGVIMVEYINQLRTRGLPVRDAAKEGAALRLRPIMMTMLVATLGLLPAAMSHDIGSDSQRPFAIVIVGGLIVELLVSVILWPTLYVFWSRPGDRLPPSEQSFMAEGEHVD
ncbi:MAG TPA: CusA/CzcA family heavy metal efflux RND transporter [Candidatus Dormibacteraeota bacterium]|nr:CusA/CzcA family heavy metal efflux RND transporter [Candidatus Dormibacteraeota bacterium]